MWVSEGVRAQAPPCCGASNPPPLQQGAQGGSLLGGAGASGAPVTGGPPVGGGLPELMTPAQVADALGVSEVDVMAIITSGELKAKKIGSSYRIKRSAVDAYLAD